MTGRTKWRQVMSLFMRQQLNYFLRRHFKNILNDWILYRHWLMSSHTLPPLDINKWRAVIHFLTNPPPPSINQCYFRFPWRWPRVFPGRLTGGAGPVGHSGDESLLFTGRLSPVALVLVGVSVWSAHRDVVFVALEIKHNQMLIKSQCDRCSQDTGQSPNLTMIQNRLRADTSRESFINKSLEDVVPSDGSRLRSDRSWGINVCAIFSAFIYIINKSSKLDIVLFK